MAKKRYTKAEEEIIQILDRTDQDEQGWRRVKRRVIRPPTIPEPQQDHPRRFNLGGTWLWLGGTFGLALLAILVSEWSRLLAAFLVIACILAFLSPIVLSRMRSQPAPTGIQRWRGKDIELIPEDTSTSERLRIRVRRLFRRQPPRT